MTTSSLYGYTMTEHEFTIDVPQAMTNDPPMRIGISAHGGWSPAEGPIPRNNGLDYAVEVDGHIVYEGGDASSQFSTPEGCPATYRESAAVLCGFLSSYAKGELVSRCLYGDDAGVMCICDPATGEADPDCTALVYDDGEVVATGEAARMIAANGDRFSVAADEIRATAGADDSDTIRAESEGND